MSSAIGERATNELEASSERSTGSVRRLGSAIGLVTITLLDLLALDDITTAQAWMPEIGFVIASVPALITLGYYTFRASRDRAPIQLTGHRTALPRGARRQDRPPA
jgi:hypothetical protein